MNKRWPWLSPGWEVVEDVIAEEMAARLCGYDYEWPQFFDMSYIYMPADREDMP